MKHQAQNQLASSLLMLALLAAATPVAAQPGSPSASAAPAAPARDDVQWTERRVPYSGGPIRPGAQLDGSISGWTWLGAAGFAGGFLLSVIVGPSSGRAYAAVPLVGPWLAVANVGHDNHPWDGKATAAMVIAGLLEPAGLAFFVFGLLNPNLFLVYDAPAEAPGGQVRLRLAPYAPSATAGLSLTLEAF